MAIPGESEYIYGFHDPGDWRGIITEKGRTGWVLYTEEIGYNPNAHTSPNYSAWSNAGFGVIVRLNNGYSPGGTIPHSRHYDDFARRCANHVGDSQGAHIWIIGNEMNHANEQPGVSFSGAGFTADELITPDKYAACFKKARALIKARPGHENDQVIMGAVAPYTAVIRYPGNENANWIKYFTDILDLLGTSLDGISLHSYTHGAHPGLILDTKQPWPQYPGLYYHFLAYRNFMQAIPRALRHLPIYITETDQSDDGTGHILPWADNNSGWVRNAYKEINNWNSKPGNQQIRCLLLYRWGKYDDWYIDGKRGVIDDFKMSLEQGYKWGIAPVDDKPYATVTDSLNVREGASTQFDRVGLLAAGTTVQVIAVNEDKSWLRVAYADNKRGWISAAFTTVTGDLDSVGVISTPGVTQRPEPKPPSTPPTATATDHLNVRKGPGTQHQRVGLVKLNQTAVITGRNAESSWLQIRFDNTNGWISAQYATVTGDLTTVDVIGTSEPAKPKPPKPKPPTGESLVVGGYTLSGSFLDFYKANGQLSGAPITDVVIENGVQTQYFQSVALRATQNGVQLVPIGREVLDARRTISTLRDRGTPSVSGSALEPKLFGFELEDVTATLPKSSDKSWAKRSTNEIAFIIIHHTGGGGTTSPARIARMMINRRDKAGINYHFYITADGTVYQTNAVNALTDHSAGQSRTSVGVALAGNFSRDRLPTDAQLSSAGELCAWLMVRHNLSASRIKGMQEIVPSHKSPGKQWRSGANWKERLLAVSEAVLDSLSDQLPVALTVSVPQPAWVDKTGSLITYNKLPANQKLQGDSLSYSLRSIDSIRNLVVHHSATAPTVTLEQIADFHVRKQIKNNSGKVTKKQWPGFGYHFYISSDGTIYKCNELATVCYHVGTHNEASVGICFAGNFTTGSTPPNGNQLAAGGEVLAYLMDQLNLDIDAIIGHKELSTTDCPGYWTTGFAWKSMLMGTVGAKLTLSA